MRIIKELGTSSQLSSRNRQDFIDIVKHNTKEAIMANYVNGDITVAGDVKTLDHLTRLLDRLEEIVNITGLDADPNWMPAIFGVTGLDIPGNSVFFEGMDRDDANGTLTVCLRCKNCTGDDFMQYLSSVTGCLITWIYVTDYDDMEYIKEFLPEPGEYCKLFPLSALCGDDEE